MVTTLRLPEELYRKLKDIAKKRGVTLNAMLIQLLWEGLKHI